MGAARNRRPTFMGPTPPTDFFINQRARRSCRTNLPEFPLNAASVEQLCAGSQRRKVTPLFVCREVGHVATVFCACGVNATGPVQQAYTRPQKAQEKETTV